MRDERSEKYVKQYKTNPRLKGESWVYFENWLKRKSIVTQEIYLKFLIGFLEWLETDTEGFYELYLGMTRDKDPRKRSRMNMLVVDHQKYLMDVKKLSARTVSNVGNAIKGFFKANVLPLELNSDEIQYDSKEIPSISKDQLAKVLNATGSYKTKAYILLARDSGLRLSDISILPIRVMRAALDDPSVEFHTFEWKQKKTKRLKKPVPANPVIGPECLDAIRTWMNYRVNKLGSSAKDEDPLFCIEKNKKGYTNSLGRKVKGVSKGDWMDDTTMGVVFYQLVRKADIKPLPNETKLPSFHSLRKYHKTTLEYANVPTSWINKMQGRRGEGTGGIYTKPNPEQLIEMFKRGYTALSGLDDVHLKKIEMLTQELGVSKYRMSELISERDKYRSSYDLRSRLQGIVDRAKLEGWPEDIIKKLEENLESVETFENGVFEFHKLKEDFEEKERSENWDYKIVKEEAEMINYLKDDWEIFKALNDGRCVLRCRSRQNRECNNLDILNELTFSQFPTMIGVLPEPAYPL